MFFYLCIINNKFNFIYVLFTYFLFMYFLLFFLSNFNCYLVCFVFYFLLDLKPVFVYKCHLILFVDIFVLFCYLLSKITITFFFCVILMCNNKEQFLKIKLFFSEMCYRQRSIKNWIESMGIVFWKVGASHFTGEKKSTS